MPANPLQNVPIPASPILSSSATPLRFVCRDCSPRLNCLAHSIRACSIPSVTATTRPYQTFPFIPIRVCHSGPVQSSRFRASTADPVLFVTLRAITFRSIAAKPIHDTPRLSDPVLYCRFKSLRYHSSPFNP